MNKIKETIAHAVFRLLRPLTRILLQHGVSYAEFSEIAKLSYVDVAEKEFLIEGRKQSVARVCVLTGIHRKDVNRLRTQLGEDSIDLESLNRAARVIGGWLSHEEYKTKAGKPALLPVEGETGSFTSLVKRFSGDMPVRAILDELQRTGAVEISATGKLKLCAEGYFPKQSDEQQLQILGICSSDLLGTISHNLNADDEDGRLQLAVAYNNLSRADVDEFKALMATDAHRLINKYNAWLNKRDRDNNAEATEGEHLRAGLGVYYFENKVEPDSVNDA